LSAAFGRSWDLNTSDVMKWLLLFMISLLQTCQNPNRIQASAFDDLIRENR